MKTRALYWVWLVGIIVSVFISGVYAQGRPESFVQQQRLFEEDIRRRFDREIPTGQRALLDWGGWYTYALFFFNDNNKWSLDALGQRIPHTDRQSQRILHRHDLRFWTQINLDRVHDFYARLKLGFMHWNGHDQFIGERHDDFEGPNLDRAWYRTSLRKMVQHYDGKDLPFDLKVQVGRQYVDMGTGLVFSTPLDAVQLTFELPELTFTGIVGTTETIRSMENVDRSVPGYNHTARCFYGGELAWEAFNDHRPFAYFLLQRDHSGEHPDDPNQNYQFDSNYFGFGSEGKLFLTHLRYAAEFVFETGRRYAYGGGDETIQAYAFDGEVEYLFKHPSRPKVSVEWLHASGDGDRLASPTDTIGGNRPGTHDKSFVGFGFRDTGLALAPQMSNLDMIRLGGSCNPFFKVKPLAKLELGTNFFFYFKDKNDGAISDAAANRDNSEIGQELDLFVNWRITSDVAWLARYGVFWPGNAYDDQSPRHFLYTAITFSF